MNDSAEISMRPPMKDFGVITRLSSFMTHAPLGKVGMPWGGRLNKPLDETSTVKLGITPGNVGSRDSLGTWVTNFKEEQPCDM